MTDVKSYTYLLSDQTGKHIGQARGSAAALEYLETMCNSGQSHSLCIASAPSAREMLAYSDGTSDDFPSGGMTVFVVADARTNAGKVCFTDSDHAMAYCGLLTSSDKPCCVVPFACKDYDTLRTRLLETVEVEERSQVEPERKTKPKSNLTVVILALCVIALALYAIRMNIPAVL